MAEKSKRPRTEDPGETNELEEKVQRVEESGEPRAEKPEEPKAEKPEEPGAEEPVAQDPNEPVPEEPANNEEGTSEQRNENIPGEPEVPEAEIETNYELSYAMSRNDTAEVYDAIDKATRKPVVLKKLKRGVSRELASTRFWQNKHESILSMLHFFYTPSPNPLPVLVFEKYRCDLQQYDSRGPIPGRFIQLWTRQLLKGLEFMHAKGYVHRDIKNQNLLLDENYHLKIADFGLTREVPPDGSMTPSMASLWYRPIEMILGATKYTSAVDIWSAACVMAQMYRRYPLFRAESEILLLQLIVIVFGSPNETDWPGLRELPVYDSVGFPLNKLDEKRLRYAFDCANDQAIDMIRKMLIYDPEKRLTATQALAHPYFSQPDFATPRDETDDPGFPAEAKMPPGMEHHNTRNHLSGRMLRGASPF